MLVSAKSKPPIARKGIQYNVCKCSLQPDIVWPFLSGVGEHILSLTEKICPPLAHLRVSYTRDTAVKERLQSLGVVYPLVLQCLRRHLKPIKV